MTLIYRCCCQENRCTSGFIVRFVFASVLCPPLHIAIYGSTSTTYWFVISGRGRCAFIGWMGTILCIRSTSSGGHSPYFFFHNARTICAGCEPVTRGTISDYVCLLMFTLKGCLIYHSSLSLVALLKPFYWQCAIVPILPLKMINAIESPSILSPHVLATTLYL